MAGTVRSAQNQQPPQLPCLLQGLGGATAMLASPKDVWDGTTKDVQLRALRWRTAWFPWRRQCSVTGSMLPCAGTVLGKGLSPPARKRSQGAAAKNICGLQLSGRRARDASLCRPRQFIFPLLEGPKDGQPRCLRC